MEKAVNGIGMGLVFLFGAEGNQGIVITMTYRHCSVRTSLVLAMHGA